MGMFDYIKFEMEIPGRPKNSEFQTKSFDNCMDHYVVTCKGELYRETWEYKFHENPNAFLGGSFEKVPESYRRIYLTDFHGDVIFYDDIVKHDFTARFTNGKLTRLTFTTRERLNGEILHEYITGWQQDFCEGSEERGEEQS